VEENHGTSARTLLLSAALAIAVACSRSDGSGSAPPVAVDQQPPQHGGLEVAPNFEGEVKISWVTDEPAVSELLYGTDSLDKSGAPGELALEHSRTLNNLVPNTTYWFQIRSTDASGNESLTSRRSFPSGPPASGGVRFAGPNRPWFPLTVSFEGPFASERDDNPNPFLDYRLLVEFDGPTGQKLWVSGYFDGDGLGGGMGNVWSARITPDEAGEWNYAAHFVAGSQVAISTNPGEGTPVSFDGTSGRFFVAESIGGARGFYARGALEYVGGHYLRFRDGSYFLKGGTDSPENLLAYRGFDNTCDHGGIPTSGLVNGLHGYPDHAADWGEGGLGVDTDPLFSSSESGYDSRPIIGALNYLSSQFVNSVYFLPMNLGGDGYDTCPFVGYSTSNFDKTHYDISKLRQWDKVFEHAMRRGILLHIVLGETETANEMWLDGGYLGVQRKLFYREMIARFGHHLAIKWNISEETSFATSLVRDFAEYITLLDPYDHPVAFHTYPLPQSGQSTQWSEVMGDPRFSMSSMQGIADFAGRNVELWRQTSANSGHPWVIDYDESELGLTDANAELLRKKVLYDVYFSGGNIEWYAGYNPLPVGGDLRMEDFRQREEMWRYTWFARRFMENHLPFWEMEPADGLVRGETTFEGGAEVFRKHNDTYAIYYPNSQGTGVLDLNGTNGTFRLRWYNPVTGTFVGAARTISGGGDVVIGNPPAGDTNQDWVVLIER